MRKHIVDSVGKITFADAHLDWAQKALGWILKPTQPQECRHAYIAPRNTGKTTWHFLILPMWAAAHGHKEFVAAFSDSSTQAETHLQTFRSELQNNELLQADYPQLCSPAKTPKGTAEADRQDQYTAASGFTFIAKGIESSNLGLKVKHRRPDLLLLDDIEPHEGRYSLDLVKKRLSTLQDAILQLNIYAAVTIVGTTTIQGSIMHQLVRVAKGSNEDEPGLTTSWIKAESISPHYYPAIVDSSDGTQRSLWPEKWPLEYLLRLRTTNPRTYQKNYNNDPKGADGDFWTERDIHFFKLSYTTRTALFVDPGITNHRRATVRSDPTGLAVVSWQPPGQGSFGTGSMAHSRDPFPTLPSANVISPEMQFQVNAAFNMIVEGVRPRRGRVQIEFAKAVQLTGKALQQYIIGVIEAYPHISRVIIETNQGGDLWGDIFTDLPVRVFTIFNKDSKEIRFAKALKFFQSSPPQATLVEPLPELEEQLIGFPKLMHDDIADAAVAGVLHFLDPVVEPREQVRITSKPYVGR